MTATRFHLIHLSECDASPSEQATKKARRKEDGQNNAKVGWKFAIDIITLLLRSGEETLKIRHAEWITKHFFAIDDRVSENISRTTERNRWV